MQPCRSFSSKLCTIDQLTINLPFFPSRRLCLHPPMSEKSTFISYVSLPSHSPNSCNKKKKKKKSLLNYFGTQMEISPFCNNFASFNRDKAFFSPLMFQASLYFPGHHILFSIYCKYSSRLLQGPPANAETN